MGVGLMEVKDIDLSLRFFRVTSVRLCFKYYGKLSQRLYFLRKSR